MLQLVFVFTFAWLLGASVGYGPNMRAKTPNLAHENAHGSGPIPALIETHTLPIILKTLGLGLGHWGQHEFSAHKYRTEVHGQIQNDVSLVEVATRVHAMSRMDPMTHVSLAEMTHRRDSGAVDCSGERSQQEKAACEMAHNQDSEADDCSREHPQDKAACNPIAQLPSSSPPPRWPCWLHPSFISHWNSVSTYVFLCIVLVLCFVLTWRCLWPRESAPAEPEWHVPVKRITYRRTGAFAESPSNASTTASEQAEHFDIGGGDSDSEAACSMYGASPVCQERAPR